MSTSAGTAVTVQGRLVWVSGDLYKGKPMINQETRQPVIDTKTGLQKITYGFGLAVPKSSFAPEKMGPEGSGYIWNVMYEEAFKIYTNRQLPPDFAFKKKDGDTDIDDKGVPYSQRQGYAGHIVFAFTTELPIKYYVNREGQYVQVNEGIKCGDYVAVSATIKGHAKKGQGKPGLYMNPNAVLFLTYGEPIINTPSGEQVFGGKQFDMSFGSQQPIAPQGFSGFAQQAVAPQQQFAPQMQQPMQTQQPQQYAQPAPVQQPIQPNYGVLPQIHQPQQMQQTAQQPSTSPQGYPQQGNVAPTGYAQPAVPSFGQPPAQGPATFAPPNQQFAPPGQQPQQMQQPVQPGMPMPGQQFGPR